MIVTKQQILDIIQVAKVMLDNHLDEVDGNYDEVRNIRNIVSSIDAGDKLEVVEDDVRYNFAASVNFTPEVYSAIITKALAMYNDKLDNSFKRCVDEYSDINVAMSVTLVGCYIRYCASSDVLKIVRA